MENLGKFSGVLRPRLHRSSSRVMTLELLISLPAAAAVAMQPTGSAPLTCLRFM